MEAWVRAFESWIGVDNAVTRQRASSNHDLDDGDDECEQNQSLRLQNPDLVAEIDDNPYYANPLGDSLAPITFVDKIQVPVFIAGAWQDEQTGGQFPTMLDRFTGTDHLYVTLTNGLHTDSLSPPVFARYAEFLSGHLEFGAAAAIACFWACSGVSPSFFRSSGRTF